MNDEAEVGYTLFVRVDEHKPGEDVLVQIAGVDPMRNRPFADGFHWRPQGRVAWPSRT